jgi:hypothetical protein
MLFIAIPTAIAIHASRSREVCRIRNHTGTIGKVPAILPTHPSQNVTYPLAGRVTINNDAQYATTSTAQVACHAA